MIFAQHVRKILRVKTHKVLQITLINRANGNEVRMEFASDAVGRYPGFEIEVTQVPCLRDGGGGGDDLPTLFYPGDSYGAPTSPVVTSRPVLLDHDFYMYSAGLKYLSQDARIFQAS